MKIYVDVLFIDMEVETYSIEVNDNINLNSAKILLQNVSYVYPKNYGFVIIL